VGEGRGPRAGVGLRAPEMNRAVAAPHRPGSATVPIAAQAPSVSLNTIRLNSALIRSRAKCSLKNASSSRITGLGQRRAFRRFGASSPSSADPPPPPARPPTPEEHHPSRRPRGRSRRRQMIGRVGAAALLSVEGAALVRRNYIRLL
jgi:hypothetical protein